MIEEEILHLFVSKKWTLSLAESCTGGAISSRLVQIANASQYFLGGVVAYSNFAKEKLLHVSREQLDKNGAVSEEVALEMSRGAQEAFASDIALAVTGIAGPTGATAKKEVGLVWFSISQKDSKTFAWQRNFSGNRSEIIEQASTEALNQLFDQLNH